jgi:hypothetical protein
MSPITTKAYRTGRSDGWRAGSDFAASGGSDLADPIDFFDRIWSDVLTSPNARTNWLIGYADGFRDAVANYAIDRATRKDAHVPDPLDVDIYFTAGRD